MKLFSTKDCNLQIKDIDTSKRMVKGYFASFGNVDSDGDQFQKGCFAKSISENGPISSKPRIKYLAFHNPELLPGKLKELGEDERGLYFTVEMLDTQLGKDILTQYEEGILTEHSVGFVMMQNYYDQQKACNMITEVKLFEGSVVTWGANMNTPVTEIKDFLHNPTKVIDRYNKLSQVLRKGNISDELGQQLELEVMQLQKLYNDVVKALKGKKPVQTTSNDKEPLTEIDTLLDKFNNRLKNGLKTT